MKPGILIISSYPPRECGIATYTDDLVKALNKGFDESFNINICAIESYAEQYIYPEEVKYILNTDDPISFLSLADNINADKSIHTVLLQHEFGFFESNVSSLTQLMKHIQKPIILSFHTVLPYPNEQHKRLVKELCILASKILIMTKDASTILNRDYEVSFEKAKVIQHGTHLVADTSSELLKAKYNLSGRKVLTTFGLLSSGKGIETTLKALPAIIEKYPSVVFLLIGKTHPSVLNREGELYRNKLANMIVALGITEHVQFINYFIPLPELLEYLQLTDIYLFTSRDPNQAVSGTFSYAISCGCPVISTPIPHAKEVLKDDAGILIDFDSSLQLTDAILELLHNHDRRKNMRLNGLHRMASTAWENAAIGHAVLFQEAVMSNNQLTYTLPEIKLDHLKRMTTDIGIIQFSKMSQPDTGSGYTLDDNARALIAFCEHYKQTQDPMDLSYIVRYCLFICYCQQESGQFLNYVDQERQFTDQNQEVNLEDSNGRALWALGYLKSMQHLLPADFIPVLNETNRVFEKALKPLHAVHSTRAMAFIIKGLYFVHQVEPGIENSVLITKLANRLVQMFRHESSYDWQWFENSMTYANCILSEALICAWQVTGDSTYKDIACKSFDFLLSKTLPEKQINVISNKYWLNKNHIPVKGENGGEQPIDVAYTILTLERFYECTGQVKYLNKMTYAFNWFLGANHLKQIVYNNCTGGCYDGLEDRNVNLNQGAESTISYLLARLAMENQLRNQYIPVYGKEKILLNDCATF